MFSTPSFPRRRIVGRRSPVRSRFLREWWRRLGEWLGSLRADNPAVFRLLILASCSPLFCSCSRTAPGSSGRRCGRSRPHGAEDAPAPDETRDAEWYFREADRAAAAGRISDALQLAFVGLALTLEAQGLLRYHASKTPAECVREANLAAADRERLRGLVRALYAYVFGGRPWALDDYHRWREAVALSWHAPGH